MFDHYDQATSQSQRPVVVYKNTFLTRKSISNSTNTHHNYFKLTLYSLKTPDSNRCLLDTQISFVIKYHMASGSKIKEGST